MKSLNAIRAFIAVPLTSDTIARLIQPVDELRAVCRTAGLDAGWSRPEGWHLTLKFLGAVTQVDPLLDCLPACAARHHPFAVHFSGFGVFPSAKRPRVLWIGVEPDVGAAALEALAREVDGVTAPLGYRSEERPFSAHLTVARLIGGRVARPSIDTLTAWMEQQGSGRLATLMVEQIALMRSDTKPGGAVYTPVAVFPLGSNGVIR